MSMKHAVLALVVERRGYGYDLAQRLDERVGPGWKLNPSAVYPALDQLERAGLVSGTVRERGTRRSTRVVYTATEAGAAALDGWLDATSAPLEPVRSELYLRLAFAQPAHRTALLARLAAEARACEQLLARYATRAQHAPAASALIDAAVAARLRAELAWIEEARTVVAGEPAQT
jgi:DNA-binding PadR family transcriptional regulator